MKNALPHNGHHLYQVGEFQLNIPECALLLNGEPVAITPKMFDVLWLLVRNSGRTVGKDELLSAVWSDSFVEESNITVTIGQLRKVLGDDAHTPSYIQTIARRGYRLVAPVSEVREPVEIALHAAATGNGLATEFRQELKHSNGGNGRLEIATNGSATEAVEQPAIEKKSLLWIVPLLIVGLVAISAAAVYVWKSRTQTIASRMTNLRAERISDTGETSGANISPDGKLIAYSTIEGGKPVIWLRQLISGKTLQIVLAPGDMVSGVSFSNDGQYIDYFHSAGGAFSDVSRVSILGGTPTKLLSRVHGSYSFSPDGTKLAFTRFQDHVGSVFIANADGSDERSMITPPTGQTIMSVDWAPDGKSIAYSLGKFMSRNNEVSLAEYDLATGKERILTEFGWNDVEGIMWLPDRSGVLVSARDTVDAIHQIWLVTLPSGDVRQVTFDSGSLKLRGASADFSKLLGSQKWLASRLWVGEAGDPAAARDVAPAAFDVAIAPDGSLVFPAADTMTTDIWISNPDGTGRRQLTNNAAVERSPAVSPDGKFIVFAASVKGKQSIWRMDIDGGNPIPLTSDDGSWPTFTSDGKFVLFNSLEGGSLLKVSIDGGESTLVFKGRAMRPAVSPDGSSFAHYGFKDNIRVLFVRKLDGGELLKEVPIPGLPVTYLQPQWTADGKAVVITAEESKVANLFVQPLDGSPMKKLTNFTSDIIFDFDISADGSRIAMVRGRWNYDTVLLTWSD